MAQIGCSEDAREPHLHFEVATSAVPLTGERVPYLIDHFDAEATNGLPQIRARQLPLDKMVVDFGQPLGHAN